MLPTSGTKCGNTPFSQILDNNRRFWGMIKYPLLNKTHFFCSLYKMKYPFCESENYCIELETFFYVHRIAGTGNLLSGSALCFDQMEIHDENRQQHAKFLPCFIISPEKLPLSLGLANLRTPLKKYSLFRENGYEHVCMLGGGGVGVGRAYASWTANIS